MLIGLVVTLFKLCRKLAEVNFLFVLLWYVCKDLLKSYEAQKLYSSMFKARLFLYHLYFVCNIRGYCHYQSWECYVGVLVISQLI